LCKVPDRADPLAGAGMEDIVNETDRERWEKARLAVIDRWRQIIERIEAQDEGGVLRLSNVMDEFCQEAIAAREALTPGESRIGAGAVKDDGVASLEVRCVFCRGFADGGGCLSMLDEFNRAVMNRRWTRAKELAEDYIGTMRRLDLTHPAGPTIH